MRLVAGVLSFVLFAPFARAEDTATAPATPTAPPPAPVAAIPPAPAIPAARVPFRVVRVMPETRQALLFDRSRNTHILAEVGGKLDGYLIEDIDDDTVSLRRDNQQVILAAPLHGGGHSRELPPVRLRSAAAPGFDAAVPAPAVSSDPRALAPIDPYADPPRPGESSAALGPAPAAPPADALPADPSIRVARAPGAPGSPVVGAVVVPGEGGVRVATAPDVGPGPALSSAPSALPVAGSLATGPGAIRVVSASPDAAPPSPSGLPAGPGSPSAGPGAWNPAPASGAGSSGAIADPIAAPSRVSPAVAIEPAADPAPGATREVRAPDAARAPDRQTADARALADILTADRPTRSPRAVAEPVAGHAAEARPASGGAAPPAAVPGDALAISRSELDGALADFARLSAGVRGSFSASGVVVDAVGDGTIFQRAGLRAGDVVTSVDGVRLRTLDDAANLYARASTARAITAQVVRAGKPIALHVVVQ
jgi:hypothetical protein